MANPFKSRAEEVIEEVRRREAAGEIPANVLRYDLPAAALSVAIERAVQAEVQDIRNTLDRWHKALPPDFPAACQLEAVIALIDQRIIR